jgi:hypothetical protein
MEISKHQVYHLMELIDLYLPSHSNFILGKSNIKFHPSINNNFLIYLFGTKESFLSIGCKIFNSLATKRNFSEQMKKLLSGIIEDYIQTNDDGKLIDILFDLHYGDFGKGIVIKDKQNQKSTIVAGVKQLHVVEDSLPNGGTMITISDPKDQPQNAADIINSVFKQKTSQRFTIGMIGE